MLKINEIMVDNLLFIGCTRFGLNPLGNLRILDQWVRDKSVSGLD